MEQDRIGLVFRRAAARYDRRRAKYPDTTPTATATHPLVRQAARLVIRIMESEEFVTKPVEPA